MKRAFPFLNFLGALGLAALCAYQWTDNHAVSQEAQALRSQLENQTSRVESQARSIEDLTRDLDGLRRELEAMSLRTTQLDATNRSLARSEVQLLSENSNLRESITNWTQALQARDDRLKEFTRQLESLALERNAAITKYNDLARRLAAP